MSEINLHQADQVAFDRLCQSVPALNGMDTAAQAIGLDQNVLLHAGPPFSSVASITRPILNSACVAAVFEGLASSFDQAEAMINRREVVLKPAQDHGVVTPLAAVVSSAMSLHRIVDLANSKNQIYAPINGGSGPAMRLGLRSKDVLAHIQWINGPFAEFLTSGIKQPIELIPIAFGALQEGDDCHGYTPAGSRHMMAEIERNASRENMDPDIREFIDASPSLFLNVWMAASKCMMMSASGVLGSSFVTAIAANGLEVGIQISGLPDRWFQSAATPPVGRFDVDLPADRALPAIGDSAVVEGLGLGAMAIHLSPAQEKNLGRFLPQNHHHLSKALMSGNHPGFGGLNCPLGLTARAVDQYNLGPVIGLGILDKSGEKGRLGGGIYQMPTLVFQDAISALGH